MLKGYVFHLLDKTSSLKTSWRKCNIPCTDHTSNNGVAGCTVANEYSDPPQIVPDLSSTSTVCNNHKEWLQMKIDILI
jgi:hypothetical protein